MTTVIKYGNTAIQTPEDLKRVVGQLNDRRERIVVVTTALGDTTNRLADALYSGSGPSAEEVFEQYSKLVESVGSSSLATFAGWIKNEFDKYRQSTHPKHSRNKRAVSVARNREDIHDTRIRDTRGSDEYILAGADRLTAYLMSAALEICGVSSAVVDTDSDAFPIRLSKDKGRMETEVDLEASKKAASKLPDSMITIVPGYIGLREGYPTTLGRGGGDITAVTIARVLGANSLYSVSEAPLKTAPIEAGRVVESIDLQEAEVAGSFGYGLKTTRVVKPLGEFLSKPNSKAFITGPDMGEKTRIDPEAEATDARFIARRRIIRYKLTGDWQAASSRLYREYSAINWMDAGGIPGVSAEIAVSPGSDKAFTSTLKQAGITEVARIGESSYVALVGSGMSSHAGISRRHGRALGSVNILRGYDLPTSSKDSVNIGVMVAPEDEQHTLEYLHGEFFPENQ